MCVFDSNRPDFAAGVGPFKFQFANERVFDSEDSNQRSAISVQYFGENTRDPAIPALARVPSTPTSDHQPTNASHRSANDRVVDSNGVCAV